MPRPPASSPEFAAYFENIVDTSKTRGEAMNRLGYSTPGPIYHHLERLGIPRPKEWSRKPGVRLQRQSLVPEIIIADPVNRAWVGGLIQGEGCIQCRYSRHTQSTCLELDVSLVDSAPIRKLSGYYCLKFPVRPIPNHEWTPQWRKSVFGLRALRIVKEILPNLTGQKLREAEKAIAFFSPVGYHHGRFGNQDIWPREEFPLRTKRRGGANVSMQRRIQTATPRGTAHGRKGVPDVIVRGIEDRAWVGALVQGEGCIASFYVKSSNSTNVVLTIGNTDQATISKFSRLIGMASPVKPKYRKPGEMPLWRKDIYGIRAIRLLREILPFLEGDKRREVERAFTFFDSSGYYRDLARPGEIWPATDFPLRSRKPLAGGRPSRSSVV